MTQAFLVPTIKKQIDQLDSQMEKCITKFSGMPIHSKTDNQILDALHKIFTDRMRIFRSVGVENNMELEYWYREHAPRY